MNKLTRRAPQPYSYDLLIVSCLNKLFYFSLKSKFSEKAYDVLNIIFLIFLGKIFFFSKIKMLISENI